MFMAKHKFRAPPFKEFIIFALIRADFQILSLTRDVFRLSSVGRTQFRNNKMIDETKVNFSRAPIPIKIKSLQQ
jgi:hypothetical protein